MKKRIIYVDDVNHSLLTIKTRLRGLYDLYPVKTSEEMFELIEKISPDLILLDIIMPEENGIEVLKRLKADPLHALIPVIFLTIVTDKRVLTEGAKLGAVDFILKSYPDEKMIECINNHLNGTTDKPIILAVDDNPSTLRTINYLLNDKYTVRTLTHPDKAANLLGVLQPDLFLLDYNMPEVNGFDLVPIIRQSSHHADTPIIFLTSEGTVDNFSVAMHLGARDFIVKPIDEDILRTKLAAVLQGYMFMRRLRTLED
ncbi:MAG: response regulator [Defluviitaleaceae bacterium]|nr:response regulator [Defluviitaleaceae bacterium]